MNNIPEVYLLQATRKHLEQAKAFQDDMGASFFEHTMYDVKDALTSILALCDMEDMKQTPRVKKYIQRVTDLLNDVRLYSSSSLFNVNHVLINVINIIRARYKGKISITHNLSFIKAYAKSNKYHLERMLLYLLIEALESVQKDSLEMNVELAQKSHDAQIFLRIKDFGYAPVALTEIGKYHKQDAFTMRIDRVGQETEITIKVPLSFDMKDPNVEITESSYTLKLGKLKKADEETPAKLVGAQERT